MEEVLFAKALDLFVDPVKQCCVTLCHCRSDRICTSERRDTYCITVILQRKCDNFCIVVSPCNRCSVFKCFFCSRIRIELLQRNIRIIFDQIRFCCCTGDNDDGIIRIPVIKTFDHVVISGNNTKCYIHIRKREVNFFFSFICDCEVCQDDIYLTGLQIFDSVSSFCRYKIYFYAKIFTDPVCEVYIVALIFTVFVYITKWVFV